MPMYKGIIKRRKNTWTLLSNLIQIISHIKNGILGSLLNIGVLGKTGSGNLLPDHKFSEIRWDKDTKDVNADDMTDEEIKAKFQLLSNQRNEQKREACRRCVLSGKRQCPFGIKYFYKGDEDWDPNIPQKGKEAEAGCVGCGWYDIEKWRQELNKQLEEDKNK